MSTMRGSAPPGPDLTCGFVLGGRWTVRPDINRVYDGEIEHQVPDKFMQVLVVLAAAGGVVSRQELFDAVWPETFVVDESLTRAISSLRKIFGDEAKSPRVIETIPKKGYRILLPVGPVETIAGGRSADGKGVGAGPAVLPPALPRRWPIAAAGAVVMVVLLGSVLVSDREPATPIPTARRQITALSGIEEYPTLAPAGDRIAFVWDGNDLEPDGVFVQVIGAGRPVRLTELDGHYAFPAWTHDSRFVAYARVAGPSRGIFKVPATGGSEIELVAADGDELLTSPTFSPDGRWLLFASRRSPGAEWTLRRRDLATGETETLSPSAAIPHGGYRPRFSPDGRRLAFLRLGADRREIVVSTVDGASWWSPDTGDRPIADFDWTPDGNGFVVSGGGEIAAIRQDGSLDRVRATTRNTGAISAARGRPVLAYSEGRRERNIWRWTPPTELGGERSLRIIHSTGWDAFPALSPDGERIAFLSDRTGTTALWIASRDGSGVALAADIDGVLWMRPAWSPDGRKIAVTIDVDGSPATCLVDVAGGRTEILAGPRAGEINPSWSRDGTALYVTRNTSEGGEIWRRPSHGADAPQEPVVTAGGASRAVESPDGGTVFFTRAERAAEIWSCRNDGGDRRIAFSLDSGEILTWQVSARGLVVGYRTEVGEQRYRIALLDLESGSSSDLLTVPGRLGFHLDVDPVDGVSLLYDRAEAVDSDIFALVDD